MSVFADLDATGFYFMRVFFSSQRLKNTFAHTIKLTGHLIRYTSSTAT